jgi:tRNA threonylcarbamoyladenosine dehydratase
MPIFASMENWSSRTALLLGTDALERLNASSVLVVGVGGVGAAAVEMLCRAGIGRLTLVDGDVVSESNRNRQLNALTSTLGLPKVEVTGKRMLEINPNLKLKLHPDFIDEHGMEKLLDSDRFDFVVDAIDTLTPKVHLLYHALKKNIPVVSAMGAGAKTDPSKIQQTDLSKTYQCALAKAVRRELGLLGIRKGLPVVFSSEPPCNEAVLPFSGERNKKSTVGTVSYMPVLFGCHLAAFVIKELSKKEL